MLTSNNSSHLQGTHGFEVGTINLMSINEFFLLFSCFLPTGIEGMENYKSSQLCKGV